MATAVRLTVLTGPHKGDKICFCGPTRCQAGRALDCLIQLTGTERDLLISRYHCQLEIDPPFVKVGDLGSRNGTYLNGKRLEPLGSLDLSHLEEVGCMLNDSDVITIGGTTLRFDIVDCPHAAMDLAGKPSWDGEMVKKNCPLSC